MRTRLGKGWKTYRLQSHEKFLFVDQIQVQSCRRALAMKINTRASVTSSR